MAANQHHILTVTVGDGSFQDCPRLSRYRYLCWRGEEEGSEVTVIVLDQMR